MEHSGSKCKYSEDDIIKMLELFCAHGFRENAFQKIAGIPMGTDCTPLLADNFPYSYKAEFINLRLQLGSISHTGMSMMYCPSTSV